MHDWTDRADMGVCSPLTTKPSQSCPFFRRHSFFRRPTRQSPRPGDQSGKGCVCGWVASAHKPSHPPTHTEPSCGIQGYIQGSQGLGGHLCQGTKGHIIHRQACSTKQCPLTQSDLSVFTQKANKGNLVPIQPLHCHAINTDLPLDRCTVGPRFDLADIVNPQQVSRYSLCSLLSRAC